MAECVCVLMGLNKVAVQSSNKFHSLFTEDWNNWERSGGWGHKSSSAGQPCPQWTLDIWSIRPWRVGGVSVLGARGSWKDGNLMWILQWNKFWITYLSLNIAMVSEFKWWKQNLCLRRNQRKKVLRSVFGTKTDFDPITKPSKSLKAKLGFKTGSASNEASLLI